MNGGNVGIGTATPSNPLEVQIAAGGNGVDQSQTTFDIGTIGSLQWQSFTAGISGNLTGITLYDNWIYTDNTTVTYTIYSGTGTGGTVLSTTVVNYPTGQVGGTFTVSLTSPPPIIAGSVYTFSISGMPVPDASLLADGANLYPAGQYYSNTYGGVQPGWSLYFQTIVNSPAKNFIVNSGTGALTVGTMAGVGSRLVTADASGNLTATTSTSNVGVNTVDRKSVV